MGAVRVVGKVEISDDQLQKLLTARDGAVFQAMRRIGTKAVAHAKTDLTAKGLIDTGQLRNSIESQTFVQGNDVITRIGTDKTYATFVHEGTTGPIIPRTARALQFVPKSGATVIYRASVKGTKETGSFSPFLTNALKKLDIGDLAV